MKCKVLHPDFLRVICISSHADDDKKYDIATMMYVKKNKRIHNMQVTKDDHLKSTPFRINVFKFKARLKFVFVFKRLKLSSVYYIIILSVFKNNFIYRLF